MKINTIILSILILIPTISLMFLISNTLNLTGTVVLQTENYIDDNLTGEISITIEKGHALNRNIPILILLTKNNTIVKVETLTLEKFVQLSGSKTKPVNSNYKTPETFSINLEDTFPFTFNESGKYELLFSVLELDINIKKAFNIIE